MSFLEKIRPLKEAEVEGLRVRFARCAPARPAHLPIRGFAAALAGGDRLIAEVKRKSPSHPAFAQTASPPLLASAYRRNGAAALSIVTDEAHFGTSNRDIAGLRLAAGLPVLAKDFVLDGNQILAAWEAGADAVLLIARMLERPDLDRLLGLVRELELAALVECHDEADIAKAAAVGARIVGVNNRDLATLTTDLTHGERLLPHVPEGALRVAESGLYRRGDLNRLAAAGADAFLIGHALLQSSDPGGKVAELSGRVAEDALRVKICGLTTVEDARAALAAGAHILGLVFAASPRGIDVDRARAIREAVPDARLCGVFQDQDPDHVARVARQAGLDLIQLHGEESPDEGRRIAAASGLPIIRALTPDRVADDTDRKHGAAYYLVDLPKGASGATANDREAVLEATSRLASGDARVFLAGGLTATDLPATLGRLRPYGLDVSRGVELAPGVKDHTAIRTFIREAGR